LHCHQSNDLSCPNQPSPMPRCIDTSCVVRRGCLHPDRRSKSRSPSTKKHFPTHTCQEQRKSSCLQHKCNQIHCEWVRGMKKTKEKKKKLTSNNPQNNHPHSLDSHRHNLHPSPFRHLHILCDNKSTPLRYWRSLLDSIPVDRTENRWSRRWSHHSSFPVGIILHSLTKSVGLDNKLVLPLEIHPPKLFDDSCQSWMLPTINCIEERREKGEPLTKLMPFSNGVARFDWIHSLGWTICGGLIMVPMSSIVIRLTRTFILIVGKQGPKGKTGSDSVDLWINISWFPFHAKHEKERVSGNWPREVSDSKEILPYVLCKLELKFTDWTAYLPKLATFGAEYVATIGTSSEVNREEMRIYLCWKIQILPLSQVETDTQRNSPHVLTQHCLCIGDCIHRLSQLPLQLANLHLIKISTFMCQVLFSDSLGWK
jgi:hypothetical protein